MRGLIFLLSLFVSELKAQIVVNEIMYDPVQVSEKTEFLELYNSGGQGVDLSGWFFDQGINFEIPPGTQLPAGEYLLIAEDPTALTGSFTIPSGVNVLGPFGGNLANEGESIRLRRADGLVQLKFAYGVAREWPLTGMNGRSIQLQNPLLNPGLAGAWRPATPTPGQVNLAVYQSNPGNLVLWNEISHSPQAPRNPARRQDKTCHGTNCAGHDRQP